MFKLLENDIHCKINLKQSTRKFSLPKRLQKMTKQSVNIASEILDLRDDNFLDCRKNREIVERENSLIHTNHGITGVNKEWGKKKNGMVKSKQRKAGIAQKMKFPLRISSVNVTKSAVS